MKSDGQERRKSMARKATGQVVERVGKRGVTYALRYRVPGHGRVYETLGDAPDWDNARAEQELENRKAQIRLGIWQPPKPEPTVPVQASKEVPELGPASTSVSGSSSIR